MKTLKQNPWHKKIFLIALSSLLFIALSKVKLTLIIGTRFKFSAVAIFGPILGKILGVPLGVGTIALSHAVGILLGFYKIENARQIFTFVPLMIATTYFARIFKGDKKLITFPTLAILLFVVHPIGRKVWFYSLFWTIPIFVAIFKKEIEKSLKHKLAYLYAYSLATTFVDHAIGSIVFLYFLNIPANAWIAAIPFTAIERLTIALGIEFTYLIAEKALAVLESAAPFTQAEETPSTTLEK